ncbi:MAG: amidohydrolase [Thaumarchaeota archaeon]|nr:amidohydrolase [Nitrososphaerota archaeon]
MFCHIFPQRLLKSLTSSQLPSFLTPNPGRHFTDAGHRVKVMDRFGIQMEALTVSLPSFWGRIPNNDRRALTRLSNDALAEVTDKFPDRLIPVASLPDPADQDALDELDRGINELGMKGCMIFSNVDGKPLDSIEFDPFFQRMEKYDLPVLLHPMTWQYYPWIREYDLFQTFGWPFDTSLAMARLVFGGVLQRHPELKVVCHHVGAMIPHFSERIRGVYDTSVERGTSHGEIPTDSASKTSRAITDPIEAFKKFYADTVTNGGLSALRCGYEFFGAEKLVFATDYPFGPDQGENYTKGIIKNVVDLRISEEEREKIFEINARNLLRLD